MEGRMGATHEWNLSILEVCDRTMMEACPGGAWPSMIREGTWSNQIMYKVTGFMITFWITILLTVELIMAKYGTSLRNIYIMNDYGVVCWIRLDDTEPWLGRFRRTLHGLGLAAKSGSPTSWWIYGDLTWNPLSGELSWIIMVFGDFYLIDFEMVKVAGGAVLGQDL